MPDIPEPRTTHEHVEPCRRHHNWHVNCPECGDWNRSRLRHERDEAAQREARR